MQPRTSTFLCSIQTACSNTSCKTKIQKPRFNRPQLIRTDYDAGFTEGRQYGRGKSGGQVRDEYRTDYDAGRGGYGMIMKQKLEIPDFIK